MHVIFCLLSIAIIIEGVILDPSIYLSPSPPLTTTQDNDPEKLWSRSVDSGQDTIFSTPRIIDDDEDTTKTETMEGAETFWPSLRSSSLRGIYIPMSFHLSGTYGGRSPSGGYSSSYIGVDNSGSRGKAVLAGTSYQSYGHPGLRIYGGETKPAWSGWGNGKWGHYGKG